MTDLWSNAIFAQGEGQGAPLPMQFAPFIIIGLMLLFMWRMSSKQKKELQKALSALKKNDQVVTSGGIIGHIISIKENEDEVTLKVDDKTDSRVRVLKSSITKILSAQATETKA